MLGHNSEHQDADRITAIATNPRLTATTRLIQLLGIPAGLALMGWAGLSLVDLKADVAVVKSQLAGMGSLYHATDADRDFRLRDQRLDQVDRDVATVNRRLDRLESKGLP